MSAACCDLNEFLAALADETRQRILTLLGEREMTVSELSEQFAVTQPTVSHHLAILRRARLVISHRSGRYVFYRANPMCVAECCREIQDRFTIPRPTALIDTLTGMPEEKTNG
jgi:DNA-binding transcriptional ArsR family regulator